VSVVFVAGAGCCPCCVYWLAGRWVKGKGERQYKINIPTQIISPPPLISGGDIMLILQNEKRK